MGVGWRWNHALFERGGPKHTKMDRSERDGEGAAGGCAPRCPTVGAGGADATTLTPRGTPEEARVRRRWAQILEQDELHHYIRARDFLAASRTCRGVCTRRALHVSW